MNERIPEAAIDCAANCQNRLNPLSAITAYVQRLSDQGWTIPDANEVGRRALFLIAPNHPLLVKFR